MSKNLKRLCLPLSIAWEAPVQRFDRGALHTRRDFVTRCHITNHTALL